MKKLPIILFILSTSASAQEVSISYGKANELILTSKSCEQLIEQHQAICAWKKQIEPNFTLPKVSKQSCRNLGSRGYSMTISQCLPSFVKANQRKKLVRSGANCWGTALSLKGNSIRPRFVWPEEIEYWMDSPVCRKVEKGEQLEPGDIINVYGPEYLFGDNTLGKGEHFWEALYPGRLALPKEGQTGYSGYHNFLHSETYLTPELAFGKDSPSYEDRFEFHPLREVYGRSRDTECQENGDLEPYRREYQNAPRSIKYSKCDYFTVAYRCGSIKDYFEHQNLTGEDAQLWGEINELKLQQDKLFPLMLSASQTLSSSQVRSFLALADRSAQESLDALSSSKFSQQREMLLTLKYFTAAGIRKSLELAKLTAPTEPL